MFAQFLTQSLAFTAAALAIEVALGFPEPVFRLVRHPVVWIGALIAALDRRLPRRRRAGALAMFVVLAISVAPTAALVSVLQGFGGVLLLAVLGSTLLAQRSLDQHVAAVATGLRLGLPQGRAAVSQIVGRDPERLDEAGVARAAIESLAENFSDGVVAPAFWGALLGLPGMTAYKAVNTADSMIGHRTPRHERFGWFAARLDDWLNLVPSRLAALWLLLAALLMPGARSGQAWRAVWRDASRHRSPSAGWPEAAMAGALGLRIAGPRFYHGVASTDGWMGNGRAAATADDITRARRLYWLACVIQLGVVALLAVIARC
ncbi:MAG: adenosylcobinamide-phosphate synthase CbiB [Janthinobacterium lividum]